MYLEHNSHLDYYRSPFGAVATEQAVTLKLSVSEGGIPHGIYCLISDGMTEERLPMVYAYTINNASVYQCTKVMPSRPCILNYYFEVQTDSGTLYYGNNSSLKGGIGSVYGEVPMLTYQITVYDKDYRTPDWFKTSIVYQIFPDRFYNGNENNEFSGNRQDICKRQWGEEPFCTKEQFGGEYLCNDFFGGNLKGIEKKIPYLKDLGISAIYLNPIFKAYSNHRYDTGDYEQIDELLGNELDFVRLCRTAKEQGISIILDGVFNHTGSNSKYFNKDGTYQSIGAYQSESSPYADWYRFGKTREDYECWWGMKTLPHTEENSQSFQKYIVKDDNSIIKKWLRLGARGWRLDVVDELPGFFVKLLRQGTKEANEDAVLIGEVWEDASNKVSYGEKREYFLGKELDSVMNYPLRNAILDVVTGATDTKALSDTIMSLKENYPPEAFLSCLNMMSSHDVERLLTAVSGQEKPADRLTQSRVRLYGSDLELAKKKAVCVTALQMTLPGVPCIYYGDELAMEGFGDPSCRRCMDWTIAENNSYKEEFKKWISIRNNYVPLQSGDYETLYNIDNVFAFARTYKGKSIVVVANMSGSNKSIRIDTGRLKISTIGNIHHKNTLSSDVGVFWLDIDSWTVEIYECD